MCIGFVCFVCFCLFFTGGCECFLSRALLSGSHYVLSLCHCVTLLCYAPDVEQIKMMMMMMMKISNKIARISSSLAILSEILI